MSDQQQLDQERLEMTLDALERIREAGARPDDIDLLARELGVWQWMKTTDSTDRRAT